MKNDLTCAVALDLLPSYADGLTSEETNEALTRHMETCGSCRAAFEKMTAPETAGETAANDEKEISFLKKVKRKHLTRALCCVLAALLLSGGVFGCLYYKRVYLTETPVARADADVAVSVTDGTFATISLHLRSAEMTGGRHTKTVFDETDGRLTFSFTKRRAKKGNTQEINANFRTDGKEIKSVYLDDVPLWENGMAISERAASVYAAAHPYIGDMTLNAESAMALEIGKTFGAYENELTTSRRPYEWKMTFAEPLAESAAFAPGGPLEDAFLLLATVENLETVIFSFPNREIRLAEESANRLVAFKMHMGVKKAGQTPSGVQTLLDTIRSTTFISSNVTDGQRWYSVIVEAPQTEAP